MRRLWCAWSLVTLGACSNIIGLSEIDIDPALEAGGSSNGGRTSVPDAGEPSGGQSGSAQGGTTSGGRDGAGASGEAGAGGEPPSGCRGAADCDDEITCTVDSCLPNGECSHSADDTACTPAAGKCSRCQLGIGCVDTDPVERELLLDGGFDEQSGDWQDLSSVEVIVPDANAQSGARSARFDRAEPTAKKTLFHDVFQVVQVPDRLLKLTASGWYKMVWAAEEIEGRPRDDEYVTLTLFSLENDSGDFVRYWDFDQWDATGTPQTEWKSFTYSAPTSVLNRVEGLEITLDLVAETWDTQFYFDTLSLKALACE
jgi:hypothetical protein